jgi:ribosomal-protein-alanine N-acetyltransferase
MPEEGAAVDLDIRLEGNRVALRAPRAVDIPELRALIARNADHLRPWSPSPPPGTNPLGLAELGRTIAKQRREWKLGAAYVFVAILRYGREPIAGRVALTSVTRGPWQSAQVGYWLDAASGGRGLMTECVGLALDFAFEDLGLHRVQAAVMPRNAASRRILAKCGFREEGYAERYLRIGGRWEDHVIYGLTAEEWQPGSRGEVALYREATNDRQLLTGSSR